MTSRNFTVVFSQQFTSDLDAVLDWLNDHCAAASVKFITELHDIIQTEIAARPESFMEYPWKKTPDKRYRRAIFKKKWYIVFKIVGQQVELLVFYHASRNPEKVQID